MQENMWVQILWVACVGTAIVASVLAIWSRRALYIYRACRRRRTHALGRGSLQRVEPGLGGRLRRLRRPGAFRLGDNWRAVVAPNQLLFIGLLVAFEAVFGVLILSGGRRTQLGLIGAIGFHAALWLFGWGVTIYSILMVAALVLLVRAERRAARASAAPPAESPRRKMQPSSPH
jgi:hypothetical protein